MKFLVFGAKWKQVVQVCSKEQSEKNVFVDKKTKKHTKRATSFQFFGCNFVSGSENCNLSVHESIFRRYFFCEHIALIISFPTWGGKFSHSCQICSAVFPKICFTRSEEHFEVKCLFEIVFVFISKVLGYKRKKFTFLSKSQCKWSKLQPTCPKNHSKKKVFPEKEVQRRQLADRNSDFSPKLLSGLSKQHSTLPEKQFSEEGFF